MLNFVYCLDENYNEQCLNSIYSILNYTNTECSFYIIHQSPNTLEPINKKILKHKNLKELVIKKFNDSVNNFVNLERVHVTEASYYRLFISKYLPKDISKIVYIDPDVICLKKFNNLIVNSMKIMEEKNYNLAAVTEDPYELNQNNARRLNLKNEKYFNAGVLIINVSNWREENIIEKFSELLKTNKDRLELHDQDILNIFYDGFYLELDKGLNFTVPGDGERYLKKINDYKFENITFLHYSGNKKPWQLKGILHEAGEYYRESYEKLYQKKYHITDTSKKNSFRLFLKLILEKRINELKYPFHFIYYFFRNLIKIK